MHKENPNNWTFTKRTYKNLYSQLSQRNFYGDINMEDTATRYAKELTS